MSNYLDIVLRSGIVFIFMIFAVRLFGKKELSQLNISDLILILLISNSVQNAMVGADSSLTGGLLAAFTLFILNYLIKKLIFKSPAFGKLLEGEAMVLVYKGQLNTDNLGKVSMNMSELEEAIREHGVSGIDNVALAMLEMDGSISVVSKEIKSQTFHKRKRGLHAKFKKV